MKKSLLALALGATLALAPISSSAMKAIPVHGLKAMTWDAESMVDVELEEINDYLSTATDALKAETLIAYAGEDPSDILGYTGVVFTDGESAAILQALTRLVNTSSSETSGPSMNKAEMVSTRGQKAAVEKLTEMIYADITADKPHTWEKALVVIRDLPSMDETRSILKEITARGTSSRDLGLAQAHMNTVIHQPPPREVQNTPQTYEVGSGDKEKKGKFTKGVNKLTTKSGIIEVATH